MSNTDTKINGYELSRQWFDFCFENPEKINPKHTAIYFFAIEHCNRLGWKRKFGFPTQMAMDAIGIKSYNTYIKAFRDIVKWGFFELIEKSKNQYSANIIALSKINKASDKALDKAFTKHASKHQRSTLNRTDSINKQINKQTKEPTNTARPRGEPPGSEDLPDHVKGCPIPDPLEVEGFTQRYQEFCEYLETEKKQTISIQRVQSQFRRLLELQEEGNPPLAVMDQTMNAGNKSFYPLKDRKFKNQNDGKNDRNKHESRADRYYDIAEGAIAQFPSEDPENHPAESPG